MELIDYTNKWGAGEIMEDFAMIVGGVFCLVFAFVAPSLCIGIHSDSPRRSDD